MKKRVAHQKSLSVERLREALQVCVGGLTTNIGSFNARCAQAWSYGQSSATRRISGHPGSCAALYVSETLGQFDIQGELSTRYLGMEREAGEGNSIRNGSLLIEVEIMPHRGTKQAFEVPVAVHNGEMLQPALLFHRGKPYVIAQSSLSELVSLTKFDDEREPDRKHMFSYPKF